MADHPAARARQSRDLVAGLDPFELFCAYHLGLFGHDAVGFKNLHDVARHFAVSMRERAGVRGSPGRRPHTEVLRGPSSSPPGASSSTAASAGESDGAPASGGGASMLASTATSAGAAGGVGVVGHGGCLHGPQAVEAQLTEGGDEILAYELIGEGLVPEHEARLAGRGVLRLAQQGGEVVGEGGGHVAGEGAVEAGHEPAPRDHVHPEALELVGLHAGAQVEAVIDLTNGQNPRLLSWRAL